MNCTKKITLTGYLVKYADLREGYAPTAIYLQRLCEMGADISYILTGRRALAV